MLSIYGKADGSPDCRDRTKKYLIHNYQGQQEPSFSFKGNNHDSFCQLQWDLKGTNKCGNLGSILHFPDEHVEDDQSSRILRTLYSPYCEATLM